MAVQFPDAISTADECEVPLPIKETVTSTTNYSSTHDKQTAILHACQEHDIDTLTRLADLPGGLLDDETRKSAWPVLLNYNKKDAEKIVSDQSWRDLPPHTEEGQVKLDVDRAFVYYPNDESEKSIRARKARLLDLIVRLLRTHPKLSYFQGFHDIVQVLLLVLGEEGAYPAVVQVSFFRIRDYMLQNLNPAIKHLQLIPVILQAADASLAQRLSHTQPHFALSATLTLYAHDIQEYSDIARLYDFILAHPPVVTIYLFVALVTSRREELLEVPLDEPDMLYYTLSKLPQPLDLEGLIAGALRLFQKHPPDTLPGSRWRSIPSTSVLKTVRSLSAQQNLAQAEATFSKQRARVNREEVWKRSQKYLAQNRTPALTIGGALLAGAFSFWLRRTGNDRILLDGFWRMYNQVFPMR